MDDDLVDRTRPVDLVDGDLDDVESSPGEDPADRRQRPGMVGQLDPQPDEGRGEGGRGLGTG